jgi:hypothetical protein
MTSLAPQFLLLPLFLACLTWTAVTAFPCNECFHNASAPTDISRLCEDPFEGVVAGIGRCDGSACTKFISTNTGHRIVRRSCVLTAHANICRPNHIYHEDDDELRGTYCTCSTQYCNSADSTQYARTTRAFFLTGIITLWVSVSLRQLTL